MGFLALRNNCESMYSCGLQELQQRVNRRNKLVSSKSKTKAEKAAMTFKKDNEGEGEELLKSKEKDGREHKTIQVLIPRGQPHHKQASSRRPLVHP